MIVKVFADKMAVMMTEVHPHLAQQALRLVIEYHNETVIPKQALRVTGLMSDNDMRDWENRVRNNDWGTPFDDDEVPDETEDDEEF